MEASIVAFGTLSERLSGRVAEMMDKSEFGKLLPRIMERMVLMKATEAAVTVSLMEQISDDLIDGLPPESI